MTTAANLYREMTLAYQQGDDNKVLELGNALKGKRLAKAKQADVIHMLEVTNELLRLKKLHDTFDGKELSGTLRWFDALSGEGMAAVAGHSVHVHFTAFEGIDKNNYTWPTEADREKLGELDYNMPAMFKVYVAGNGALMAEKVVLL